MPTDPFKQAQETLKDSRTWTITRSEGPEADSQRKSYTLSTLDTVVASIKHITAERDAFTAPFKQRLIDAEAPFNAVLEELRSSEKRLRDRL